MNSFPRSELKLTIVRLSTSPLAFFDDVRGLMKRRSTLRLPAADAQGDRGVPAFYARWSRWKDRRKQIEWPLFPGYCFVRVPEGARLLVLEVSGVTGFVGMNGRAEAVPAGEIETLRRLVSSDYRYDPYPFLAEGMEVEVVRGPLAGVRGRLVRKDNAERLVLSVTLIQQGAALHVHPADIVPA